MQTEKYLCLANWKPRLSPNYANVLATRATRARATTRGVCGNIWFVGSDSWVRPVQAVDGAIRRRGIHCGCLLVYGFYLVRESCGDTRTLGQRYFRGYQAYRRAEFHRGSDLRRDGCGGVVSMVLFQTGRLI